MKKVSYKIPAKINLTLDVLGTTDGFHDIKSLVASIDVYDTVTVKKRSDNLITLTTVGKKVDCDIFDNNAYKAAKLFMDKNKTTGVDIKIKKDIPIGGGLGGSSADIAGVLKCMEALFNTGKKLAPLANNLGSDAAYMLEGGYAVLTGRGEKISKKDINKVLYLILISEQKSTSARGVYKAYDRIGKEFKPCTMASVNALKENDMQKYKTIAKNDLTDGALTFVPEIYANVHALKKAGALTALMTGSGSCSFGVFEDKKQRDKALKKLKPLYADQLIKAQTVVNTTK